MSAPVEKEYSLAHHLGKPIIVVILDDVEISLLPEILQEYDIKLNVRWDGYPTTLKKLVKVSSLPRSYTLPREFKYVPGGTFTMGAPTEEHVVSIEGFWMAQNSVSVAEYATFIRSGGYDQDTFWIEGSHALAENHVPRWFSTLDHFEEFALDKPSQPMRGVAWYEAMAYCKWLSVISDHPFILPTEAQWEKAARGTDKRRWAFGDHWNASCADVKIGSTPNLEPKDCGIAGSESFFGCQDMVGQVWNWTLSIELPLPYIPDGSREALMPQDFKEPRIIRGGSWLRPVEKAYTYHRESQFPLPDYYRHEIGFRLVTLQDPVYLYKS
ncbi:MAG: formylglycine-generating enzyme family protein [Anaerolineae bacterium]|nr:formylglycine-generating enzyme family protein [Anaerolineae bacterium]